MLGFLSFFSEFGKLTKQEVTFFDMKHHHSKQAPGNQLPVAKEITALIEN